MKTPGQAPSLQFKIHGMDCAEEVAVLKREVGPAVGGAENLAFDVLNGRMTVTAADATIDGVREAVRRAGMTAEVWQGDSPAPPEAGRWGQTMLTAASGGCIALAFAIHASQPGGLRAALGSAETGAVAAMPVATRVLYLLAMVAGGWQFLPKAWLSLRRLRPDMNLLMTIAVAGAVALGEWFEGATVAFLFALSLALESWSVGRARRAVAALMDLAPPTARLIVDGGEREVPPREVAVGAHFMVRPGDRIPLDGRVVRGRSAVNQAPITGESLPAEKQAGDEVFAGTINGDGALEAECIKAESDTTLAHIVRMVGEAQSRRAPSEQWVEKFARVYTPAVMVLALAVFILPPLAFGGSWVEWFYRSLVLLVIACPCALVISTPVSIVAALAAAARNGVLIKGGLYVEVPAQIRAVALDKTGTLTEGKPVVVEVVPMGGHDEAELLARVAALEAPSAHPLAHAILAYARERNVEPQPAEDYQVLQGKGATGRFNGAPYWVGSHRYLEERGQETPDVHERLEALSGAGRTVVVVGNERHVCGFIALSDRMRPRTVDTIRALREAGVKHVIMLTGDNEGTARSVAGEAGVDEFRADLLPSDKVEAVEALVAKYGKVAMIGDGVNDAPALARATLGVAMGAVGSDAAIETADVALMSDDLSKLPWLIRHSRRSLHIIRQNILFSLAVKALFVVLTFAGHASLWAAIAADTGASLLVIFNGLRLLRAR